jgi:hypothetical protein
MKKIIQTTLLASFILLTGCSDKHLFKPDSIAGSVEFDNSMPAKIASVNTQGATLKNGQFITKDGITKAKLPSGFDFLAKHDGFVVSANELGDVVVQDGNATELYRVKFDSRAVSAIASKEHLAVITADNTALLYDSKTKTIVFKQKNEDALSVNAKIAAPQFLNDLIIYPTLDGKLMIYDAKEKKVIKDLVVSNDKNFNNIIFLDVIEDRLIAATMHKVFSVSPKYMNSFDADVVDIIFIKNGVYIFTADGKIIMTDPDLRKLGEKKFPFARFVGAIYGKYIYAVEAGGYLIATDIGLKSSNTFKFSGVLWGTSSFDDYLFTTREAVYYSDKQFVLAK